MGISTGFGLFLLCFVVLFAQGTASIGVSIDESSHGKNVFPFAAQRMYTSPGLYNLAENQVRLLQVNGVAEYVARFHFKARDLGELSEVEFVYESSESDVLPMDEDHLVTTSQDMVLLSRNISTSLSFDRMVGKVEYTIIARRRDSKETLGRSRIDFVIAGISWYTMDTVGNRTTKDVVSGEYNRYALSYQKALDDEDAKVLHVFVQYLDGSTSNAGSSVSMGYIPPSLDSLQYQITHRGQIGDDKNICDRTKTANFSKNRSLVFPLGCGIAWIGAPSSPKFGIRFLPFRAGIVTVHFVWDRFTAGIPGFEEEEYYNLLQIDITGRPPVAVTSLDPIDRLYRRSGGELLKAYFINGQGTTRRRFVVAGSLNPFVEIVGSYSETGYPEYSESIVLESGKGHGQDLPWNFQYAVGDGPFENAEKVSSLKGTLFSYDPRKISIDSITPSIGSEQGGEIVTVTGYFAGWEQSRSGIFFSGKKLAPNYILAQNETALKFLLPPKDVIGSSFEYDFEVQVADERSNKIVFAYPVQNLAVRISQTGTSKVLGKDSYELGKCSSARFTAIISPYVSVNSYEWSLAKYDEENKIWLKETVPGNSSAQTIEISSKSLSGYNKYNLRTVVEVGEANTRATAEIFFHLIDEVKLGAFILKPPVRSIAHPASPLRLSAMVEPPGECYAKLDNASLVFRWKAFGKEQTYSSSNATGIPREGATHPSRLGWEYVILQEDLQYGTHTIVFDVHVKNQSEIHAFAEEHVTVVESALVPQIRSGESEIMINTASNISMFATSSYDPDVISGDNTIGISYLWNCSQLLEGETRTCPKDLLPDHEAPSFVVQAAALGYLPRNVTSLRYTLQAFKGQRKSPEVTQLIYLEHVESRQPSLMSYTVDIVNGDNEVQPRTGVRYYEEVILQISGVASEITWTYELLEPNIPTFFSSRYLISNPNFYSTSVAGFGGSDKPLGIKRSVLNSHTTYTIRITFSGDKNFVVTSTDIAFTTVETPRLYFPTPPVMSGTASTQFTLNAGSSKRDSAPYSYYFFTIDSNGDEFCVGGCTGYDVARFRIGRAGTYKLRADLYDSRGKSLITSDTLSQNLTILNSAEDTFHWDELEILYRRGDDSTWTSLAYDFAEMLADSTEPATVERMQLILSENEAHGRSENSFEDKIVEFAAMLAERTRGIFCGTPSNSYHMADFMSIAHSLSKLGEIHSDTIVDLVSATKCCVANAPPGTSLSEVRKKVPNLMENLLQSAMRISRPSGRRRLLQDGGQETSGLAADIYQELSCLIVASSTSNAVEGFTDLVESPQGERFGYFSIAVAANSEQLPQMKADGRQSVGALGKNQTYFHPNGACKTELFPTGKHERRYLVFYAAPNFVIDGNFQDAPGKGILDTFLYSTSVFQRNADMKLEVANITQGDPCYCWRIQISENLDVLRSSGEDLVPGVYSVKDLKEVGVDVEPGKAFKYDYESVRLVDWSLEEKWVEACSDSIGIVGGAVMPRAAVTTIAPNGLYKVSGVFAANMIGFFLGAFALLAVTIGASWVVVTRAVTASIIPLAPIEGDEDYVERDLWARQMRETYEEYDENLFSADEGESDDNDNGGSTRASIFSFSSRRRRSAPSPD